VVLFIIGVFLTNIAIFTRGDYVESEDMLFTLVVKTRTYYTDYFQILKDDLAKLNINLDIIVLNWQDFAAELLAFRDFDLSYLSFVGLGIDPAGISQIYSENEEIGILDYYNEMDYNQEYEMGKNEWFIKEGLEILPLYSTERIEHYWKWQNYLVDEILPCQPMFTLKDYCVSWTNLEGFNYSDGLIKSWGKMSWDGSHQGQESVDEVVICEYISEYEEVPRDYYFKGGIFLNAIHDSLLYFDNDYSAWPHLAKNWEMINNTHLRLYLRENVKWQSDLEGNYTDEYFDVQDVYFTYYIFRDSGLLDWLKEMKIIDNYTIDFFIDSDSETIKNDPGTEFLDDLTLWILPEHYLNQTQQMDGKTPDYKHTAWEKYDEFRFGTGLFKIDSKTTDEINLSIFSDSWYNSTATKNDQNLNWEERFGTNYIIPRLKILINFYIPDYFQDLMNGKLDVLSSQISNDEIDSIYGNTNFNIQFNYYSMYSFIIYNFNPSRARIGDSNPCDLAPEMTKGLALRKAISYALNRPKIIEESYGSHAVINDYPFHMQNSIWCNPNIIRYNYNLSAAQMYLDLAFGPSSTSGKSDGMSFIMSISSLYLTTIITYYLVMWKKRRKN